MSTSDFQRSFLTRGVGNKLFTQEEFDKAVTIAQAEIMQIAIDTTKTAIAIEREECAKIADKWTIENGDHGAGTALQIADEIRNRLKKPKEQSK